LGWEITFHANGDALADAANFLDRTALYAGERRVNSAKQKDAGQPHALQRLLKDAGFESGDVGGDVGEFRH
jgi:hypothetical protein